MNKICYNGKTISGQLSKNFTCQNKNLLPRVWVPFVKKLEPYSTVCLTDIHSPSSKTTMSSVLIKQSLKIMLWKSIFFSANKARKKENFPSLVYDKSANPEWPIRDCIYLPFVECIICVNITRPQRKAPVWFP